MKTLTKKLLVLAAIASIQAPLCAYKFTFKNRTGKGLFLAVNVSGQIEKAGIANNASHTFDFDKMGGYDKTLPMFGLCLTNVTAISPGALLGSKQVKFSGTGAICKNATFQLVEHDGDILAREELIVDSHN